LGEVNKRVDTVEANVLSIQRDIEKVKDQIKGDNHFSSDMLDIIPSLLAAERATFANVLVIRGMKDDQANLETFVSEMLLTLSAVNQIQVVALSFMGKPIAGRSRLIRLEVKTADQAVIILKSKNRLCSHSNWKDIYISQMRSNMAGKMEGRMNSFHRVNKELIPMKKYRDCILFTEAGIRVPLHKFAANTIQVGSSTYDVGGTVSPQGRLLSSSSGASDQATISQLNTATTKVAPNQANNTQLKSAKDGKQSKKLKSVKPRTQPLRGGGTRATKRTREKPYSQPTEQIDESCDYEDVEHDDLTPSEPPEPPTHYYRNKLPPNMDVMYQS
jgi:hypothetical protein